MMCWIDCIHSFLVIVKDYFCKIISAEENRWFAFVGDERSKTPRRYYRFAVVA